MPYNTMPFRLSISPATGHLFTIYVHQPLTYTAVQGTAYLWRKNAWSQSVPRMGRR